LHSAWYLYRMQIEVPRRKVMAYRNLFFSTAAVAYILFYTYNQLQASTFGDWYSIVLVVFLVINTIVIYNALTQIAKRTPALIINDEGVIDNASIAKMGLIKWEEIADCELKKYRGYLHLLLVLHDNQRALIYASNFNEAIIKIAIKEVGAGVFINCDTLDYDRRMLVEAIQQKLGKVHLEHHLVG